MRNPFKKWEKFDFSPVPLGLSLKFGAERVLALLALPVCPAVPTSLGDGHWGLRGLTHVGIPGEKGPK